MSTRLKPASLLTVALAVAAAACSSDDGPTTPKTPSYEIVPEKTPLVLTLNDSLQIGATVYDRANGLVASRAGMTITSADPTVLVVRNNNGVVEALKAGQTTLTYTYVDAVSKAQAKLDVPVTVTPVTFAKVFFTTPKDSTKAANDTTIFFDERYTSTVLIKDDKGAIRPLRSVTFSVPAADAAIASVSARGLVTPKGPEGSARIIASAGGLADTVVVTVQNRPVTSVTVTPALAPVKVGATVKLTAAVFGTKPPGTNPNDVTITNRTVTWTSSDASVATVDAGGTVKGVAAPAGGALVTITATVDGKSGSSQVVVNP